MEERNNKVLLTVVGVLTLIASLVGATFAFFSATSTTETPVNITTSNLNLSVNADGEALKVSGIKPTTWNDDVLEDLANVGTEGYVANPDIAVIPFVVEGTSNLPGTYVVNMTTSFVSTLTTDDVSDIKYRIYERNDTTVGNQVGTEGSFAAPTDADILTNVSFTAGDITDEYVMFVYIENDTQNDQNKLQEVDFTISLGGSATQSQA